MITAVRKFKSMIWQNNSQLKQGNYTITGVLAEGAFGTTYLAKTRDAKTGDIRQVVIKIPLEKYRGDRNYDKVLSRLVTECDKFKKLTRHNNLVEFIEDFVEPYVEYGITHQVYCVVTAFVEGQTLFQLVKELQKSGQQLSEERAIAYVQQVGSALDHMHQHKQVHRDAQPNNIMIRGKDNQAILIDLGLATDLAIATNTYEHHGHSNFASVEQHEGGAEATVDVYTLAATLYFAVTGEIPARASDREKAQRDHQNDPLIPIKRIRPDLSDCIVLAITQGMSVKAKNRPKNITKFLQYLEKPMTPPPSPQNSSSSSTYKTVKVLLKTVGFEENLSTQKTIPWAWLVWNATIYTAISALFAAVVIPRFLVLGLWILAISWGVAIMGEWAWQWASFLTLAWLTSAMIVVGTVLYGVANWLAIAYGVVLLAIFIYLWRSGNDLLKSIFRKWKTTWNLTSSNLRSSFSSQHSFLILAGANILGILLGRFLYVFLR
jgi:serine/threonine protein kinase